MCTLYKSWIRPILEYGNILYSKAANTHSCRLDNLQSRIERTCSVTFQPLLQRQHAAIMSLVCCLLAGEGRGNLSTSYVELQFFAGLISFIHMTQLNICILSISVILKHLIDLNVVG